MTKHFNPTISKLIIGGAEYEYEVRYINNRAVAIGYRADLSGADLYGVDLTSASLRAADLTGANLTSANLTRANLAGANLTRANLTRANLTFANLTFADLAGADLAGAKNLNTAYELSTVKGKPATLPEGWTYTEGKGIHRKSAETVTVQSTDDDGPFCFNCGAELAR